MKLCASLEILLRNWLAGSKTVVSISRDTTVGRVSRKTPETRIAYDSFWKETNLKHRSLFQEETCHSN